MSGKDPDDYECFKKLVDEGGLTYVNIVVGQRRWSTRRSGVYVQFEEIYQTSEGLVRLKKLNEEFDVGCWQMSGKDPDDYECFKKLVDEGGLTYVNIVVGQRRWSTRWSGVYVQFEEIYQTSEGLVRLKKLSEEFDVGCW